MLKRTVATVLAAVAVGLVGVVPAQAQTLPPTPAFIQNGDINSPSNCFVHAHAHGGLIDDNCNGAVQEWVTTNGHRWTNRSRQIVEVFELELAVSSGGAAYGTGQCINLDPANYFFYLDRCVPSDDNELFWGDPDQSLPAGDWWLISVAATMAKHQYYWMTLDIGVSLGGGNPSGDPFFATTSGNNTRAEFNFV